MMEFSRLNRLPPYVFTTVNKIKMDARHAGEDIVNLGMGNPDLATPRHIVDKLVEASRKGYNHRYSASMGITKLRMAISDWYRRRFDVHIDPETEEEIAFYSTLPISIRPGVICWLYFLRWRIGKAFDCFKNALGEKKSLGDWFRCIIDSGPQCMHDLEFYPVSFRDDQRGIPMRG